ncbi:MAG: O-antigen ligase family protein [Clostridia bacterium]|nr:O-antigen ligase family protein [Clostridia bacterium]
MERIIEKSKKIIEVLVILLVCFIGVRRGGYYKIDTLGVMYIINLLILLYLVINGKININKGITFGFITIVMSYFIPLAINNAATMSGAINIATRVYSIYLLYILITNSKNKEKYIKAMVVFIAIVGLFVLDEAGIRLFEKPLNFLGGAYVSDVGQAPETIFQYTNFLGILSLVSIVYLYKKLVENVDNKSKIIFLYACISYFTTIMFYSHSKMIFILYLVTAIVLPIVIKRKKDILYLLFNFVFSLVVFSIAKVYILFISLAIVTAVSTIYEYVLNKEKYKNLKRCITIVLIAVVIIMAIISVNKILNSSVILNFRDYFSNYRSTSLRLTYYIDGLKIAFSNPLNAIFGSGGNAFRTLYETVQTSEYVSLEVHSLFVQVLLESGILGIVGLIAIIVLTIKNSKDKVYKYMLIIYLVFAAFDISFTYLFILYFFTILLAINSNEKVEEASKTFLVCNGIMYLSVFFILTTQVIAMVIEPSKVDNLNVSLDEQQKIINECKIASTLDPYDIDYIRLYSRACVNYMDILDIKKDLYGQDNLEKRYELSNIIYANTRNELKFEKSNKYAIDDNVFYTCKYVDELVSANYFGDEIEGYEFYLDEMLNRIEEFKTHSLNDYAQIQYVLGLENIYTKFSNINTMLNSEKISSMLDNIKEILQ